MVILISLQPYFGGNTRNRTLVNRLTAGRFAIKLYFHLVGLTGFAPTMPVLETGGLLLAYNPKGLRLGIEPKSRESQSPVFPLNYPSQCYGRDSRTRTDK